MERKHNDRKIITNKHITSMNKERVVIVSAVRTAMGSFGGKLAPYRATELGAFAIKGALEKAKIDADEVDEVYMGNVLSAYLGQAPAKQAALGAGLSKKTITTTINKVCASGMKAIMLSAQSLLLQEAKVIVAGGMESMSNVPYYVPKSRFGYKYGHGQLIDGLLYDGLWEVYNGFPMGNCAENTAREMKIGRESQDEYAVQSYKRSLAATESGLFKAEIIPIQTKSKQGVVEFAEDEEYKNVVFEKIPKLSPVFDANGTVTAANSSTMSDGAAALVLMTESHAKSLHLNPEATIVSFADAEQDPLWFTTTPALSIQKALHKAKINISDVDYFEINEAFAVVALANMQLLQIPTEKVNVFGGAVALGHPLGASGARILVTLINVLKQKKGKIGVASICNGGGGASTIVIEV